VVEDDPDALEILCALLEETGHVTLPARDGLEAVRTLCQPPAPDLVVLDLWLPLAGGEDVLRFVRRDPALDGLPVVIVSGAAVPREVEEDADAVVAKPFDVQKLLALVKRLLERRRGRAAVP
jgi:CheY-like chemotaxis protein